MLKPKSFLSFTLDGITPAHIELIHNASELGDLTVSIMTDEALWGNRAMPVLTVEERLELLTSLRGVSKVTLQKEWSYLPILRELKPDFFVHGSKWDEINIRSEIVETLETWGGKLVEIPFQEEQAWLEPSHRASTQFGSGVTIPSADSRRASLGRILKFKRPILAIEAHSPLSAMVAESIKVEPKTLSQMTFERRFFDALWSSSLTDSTSRAFPDIEALSLESRISNIREIFRVSSRPLIMDLDTGGEPEILGLRVRELETMGVSAGVIEDKVGLKRNSLLGNDVSQKQAQIDTFARKISYVKDSQQSRDFMLIARVESLILDAGMKDALLRSRSYVEAGADGIMIHSRKRDPSEIYEFLDKFRSENENTPIVLVPTSFNSELSENLYARGANLIIYANHLLRAAVPAMQKTAKTILECGRSLEIEESISSIDEILGMIPGTK